MNKTLKSLQYVILDFLVSLGVWFLFFLLRRYVFEHETFSYTDKKALDQFVPATLLAAFWTLLYAVSGLYSDPYRKSRLREIVQIFRTTALGVLLIFFTIFLDDYKYNQGITWYIYLYYFGQQFLLIALVHFLLSSVTNTQIRRRKIGFPTLLIGTGPSALKIWTELEARKRSLGFKFVGCLSLPGQDAGELRGKLKHLGGIDRMHEVVGNRKIEEVIIAIDKEDNDRLLEVVDALETTHARIKVVPGIYDLLMGRVKTTHMLGSPLIEINPKLLSSTEAIVKRVFDIVVSSLSLILLAPVFLMLAIAVKINSKGPVFFRQDRIGKWGKPFKIIKFRTMYTDAEKAGPALSSDHDPRITKVGRLLRKTRLDEFPQFWNVLKGDMSIVGPRPERQFFIDQIVQIAPHYRHLHRVRPGITSWGQVKYGYASSVPEMVERMTYDILYIENISLLLDFKIMIYTVLVMIEGRGK